MRKHLVVKAPDGTRRRLELLEGRLSVGRSGDNDLAFSDDTSLSRHHLVLERDEDGWYVQDLGSKNGTELNGERISGVRRLTAGDRIAVGRLLLVFDDPRGDLAGDVTFFAGPGADLPPSATIVANLQDVLSGDNVITLSRTQGAAAPGAPTGVDVRAINALIRAGRELGIRRPLPELFSLILDLSIESVGAERGVVMTLEGEDLLPRALRGRDFQISSAVRDRVIGRRESLLVRDTRLDEALRSRDSISTQGIRTLMAAPLQTSDRVIGLIYVDSPTLVSDLTPKDLDLLTVLANVAAIRIEQERLAQVEMLEQFMQKELEDAARIQRRLLPEAPPERPGIDLAGYNAACRTVGGDYYDFFTYPDGRVALVLADVAGKGMSAALMMASLQARVHVLVEDAVSDLAGFMARLDRSVAANCPPNRFITLFFCLIDLESGTLSYCNAGHNPPLLVRASGEVEKLGGCGMMLGVIPDLGYEEKATALGEGDLLFVYSDGLSEATSATGEELGEDRLAEWLSGWRGEPAREIVGRVAQGLAGWTAGAPPADDVTIVVARRPAR